MIKKHWKEVTKEVLGKEKFKEVEKVNNATYGLGLDRMWQLENHPFKPCSKDHDLVYLISDELVKLGLKELAKRCVKEADKEFYKCCLEVAKKENSFWLKLQARVFYRLIVVHRKLSF